VVLQSRIGPKGSSGLAKRERRPSSLIRAPANCAARLFTAATAAEGPIGTGAVFRSSRQSSERMGRGPIGASSRAVKVPPDIDADPDHA